MDVDNYSRELRSRLEPIYGAGEATAMVRLIFWALKGWSVTDMVCNGDRDVSDFLMSEIEKIMASLQAGEPIQYVLGWARFCGMNLRVDSRVLIPRPETEELVDLIIDRNKNRNDLRVLDIGTGSGAIAISLSRGLPFSKVTAIDISGEALEVARKNAGEHHAAIRFEQQDVFKWCPEDGAFDIIVSNPPYIPEEEKGEMEDNVLKYEPGLALFVPDDDPILYYKRIGDIAVCALVDGGELYFEINPRYALSIKECLEAKGFEEIEIIKDISGHDRFISAKKSRK